MVMFDERERQSKKSSKPVADAEGFIRVDHSRGKRKAMLNADQLEGAQRAQSQKRSKQQKTYLHLYKFQEREHKQKRLDGLRQRFEADKAKLKAMQQQRMFRPFGS